MKYVCGLFLIISVATSFSGCRRDGAQQEKSGSRFSHNDRQSPEENAGDPLSGSIPNGKVENPLNGLTQTPEAELKQNPYKLVFDTDDLKALLGCGGASVVNQMKSSTLRITEPAIQSSEAPHSAVATEVPYLGKLEIEAADPLSIARFFSTAPVSPEGSSAHSGTQNFPNAIYDFLVEGYYTQRVNGQAFWHFPKQQETTSTIKAVEFSSKIVPGSEEIASTKRLKIDLLVRQYDPRSEVQVKSLGQSVFYETPRKQTILRRLSTVFSVPSGWWFRVKIENLGECLGKNKLADLQSSRESIRSALLYLYYSDQLKDILSSNPSHSQRP